MARFADALDRKADEIKRPPPLPVGHYIGRVAKMPASPEPSKDGKFEFLRIDCQVVSAGDDVAPDDLESFGNVAGSPFRIDFIFTTDETEVAKFESSLNRLKTFCGHCGIDIESGSLKEWLSQLPNAQFMVELKHRLNPQNNEEVFLDVGRTAAIE